MNFPTNVKYTKEHEWIRLEGDVAVSYTHRIGTNGSLCILRMWLSTQRFHLFRCQWNFLAQATLSLIHI